MNKTIAWLLLGLVALSLLAAGGRTDTHRGTRRQPVTTTPTITAASPLTVQPPPPTAAPGEAYPAQTATFTPTATEPLACYIAVYDPETDTSLCALWLPTSEFPPPGYPGP